MPRSYASPQERILHTIASHGLGQEGLFLPKKYGKNADEPADLAWYSNGTAIIFYCTESSTKSQDQMDEHNLRQAQRWVRHWSSGIRLSGRNEFKEHEIAFSEVERLIAVSVIDGPNCLCRQLQFKEFYKKRGLIEIISIPMPVIMALFEACANGPDLINFFNSIVQHDDISVEDAIRIIHRTCSDIAESVVEKVRASGVDIVHLNPESLFVYHCMQTIRNARSSYDGKLIRYGQAISSIGMMETAWLSTSCLLAEATVGRVVPGTSGQVILLMKKSFDNLDIIFFAAANSKIFADNLKLVKQHTAREATVIMAIFFDGQANENCFPTMILPEGFASNGIEKAISDLKNRAVEA